MPIRLLLGPQRPVLNLGEAIARAGLPEGRIAVISSGWQEAEGDIDDVREVVGRPLADLGLYHRAEALMERDAALREAYRNRQDQLMELQALNRLRLRQLMIAARQSLRARGNPTLVAAERRHAVSQLRALDRHHFQRICRINAVFEQQFGPDVYAPLAEDIAAIRGILDECRTVLITGGNVAVLSNRMQLFGIGPLLAERHVVAWSAGAMALAGRIVLYHERMPLARRDPELLGPGANLLPDHVFLPDTRRRLKASDRIRVGLFSRRWSPSTCVALDSGSTVTFEGPRLIASEGARRLTRDGRLVRLRAE